MFGKQTRLLWLRNALALALTSPPLWLVRKRNTPFRRPLLPSAAEFTWIEQKFMNQRCHQLVLCKGVGKIPGTEQLESYKLIIALPLLSEGFLASHLTSTSSAIFQNILFF